MREIQVKDLTAEEKKLLQDAFNAGANFLNKEGVRHVGAALWGDNGLTYLGASIRRTNASNSTCAERMALDRAVFDKCYNYKLLAIVGFFDGDNSKAIIPPCGLCRQIWSEAETYGDTNKPITVLLSNNDFSKIIQTDSRELLPMAYEAKNYKI